MPDALEAMIGGETGTTPIAPVDLAQAAIGPGMAIYSRYEAVLNQDGSRMSVHDALILINRAITEYLSPDSGSFNADTPGTNGIGFLAYQQLDNTLVKIPGSVHQRVQTLIVRAVDICATLQQQVNKLPALLVLAISCPVHQRRFTLLVGQVRVRSTF